MVNAQNITHFRMVFSFIIVQVLINSFMLTNPIFYLKLVHLMHKKITNVYYFMLILLLLIQNLKQKCYYFQLKERTTQLYPDYFISIQFLRYNVFVFN